MASPLKDIAIKYALENNWEKAIEINSQIISEHPNDIDTLNRLGYAYMQASKIDDAKKTYSLVLEKDPTNPIALKNLKKTESYDSKNGKASSPIRSTGININELYIEEAGKTRTVELKNIADKKTISTLQIGEDVTLVPKRLKIYIHNQDKQYIGMLPDSIGMRLTDLIQGGNEYKACIKAVSDKSVVVFIKETKKAPKFKNQPSFITTQVSTTKSSRSR